MHVAALGIAIDVTHGKDEDREKNGHTGDGAGQTQARQARLTAEGIVREDGTVRLYVMDVYADADDQRQDVESHTRPDEPLGENAEFFAKGGALALPAEANQA